MKIKLWPAIIVTGFTILITADIILVVIAFTTQDRVVESYTQSHDR
jgi:hypothetical protein